MSRSHYLKIFYCLIHKKLLLLLLLEQIVDVINKRINYKW